MIEIPFIDLKAQQRAYKDEIDLAINGVLESCHFIQGEANHILEAELSRYVGVKHAITCSNGTDALVLALMALDIQPGDEVIVPTFTFIATAEAVSFLHATPVFADIDEKTYNVDIHALESLITPKTKCIIPVSLFGQMPPLNEINQLAEDYSKKYGHTIHVIEDAAQSFGATFCGKRSGSLTEIATTSFFPAKPLGCYGDGGAIFTNDDVLAGKMRMLLNHGQREKYCHDLIGMNGRLDALQAAILSVKLRHFDEEIEKRQQCAAYYDKHLNAVETPYVAPNHVSVWAQFCVRSPNRETIMNRAQTHGIPTAIYYPIPLHQQPVFQKNPSSIKGTLPVAETVCEDIFALPMSAFLSEAQQAYIVEIIND